MIEKFRYRYPNLDIAGYHDGYFKKDSLIIEDIFLKKPDLIFVALGVPLQENWIATHLEKFDKGIFIGVGGSFDVFSGNLNRSPISFQKMHLEWLFRMIQEPKKIMKLPLVISFMSIGS